MLLLGGGAIALPAQSGVQVTPMAQAILLASRSDPVPLGGALNELRVVQPILTLDARALRGLLIGTGTLNFEAVTMPGGELSSAVWGEGFVDRRHPHTVVHELNVAGVDLLGRLDGRGRFGVVVGKGFVPFGTDDPMSRWLSRYPVNHHLAQIVERAIAAAQYDVGKVTIEGALFNGDEPERPDQWPLIKQQDGTWRFGDSWSARLTLRPVAGLELQGSQANAHSPEHRPGAGGDAVKSSVSARWKDSPQWGERYVLAEWARTSELEGTFVFQSVLVEGMLRRGRWSGRFRLERTDRPEEERLDDPFRSRRPHLENSILGISRWSLNTLGLATDLARPGGMLQLMLFVEGTFGQVKKLDDGIFDPIGLYGTTSVGELRIGFAAGWGMRNHRMGRYGVLASTHADQDASGMSNH